MKRTFEAVLVEQCAPTLMGVKPASLFRYQPVEGEALETAILGCTEELACRGITIKVLKLCARTGACLVYLYREAWLNRILMEPIVRRFLSLNGYTWEQTSGEMLHTLAARLCLEQEYPHEIGVFLGYPLEDVEGFIIHRGRNFTCSGLWKVYGDPVAAQQRFDAYRRCTADCVEKWKHGSSLTELIAS